MARLNAANNAITTISEAMDATQTTVNVVDPSLFPSPPFRVTIEDEIMEVSNVNSTTLTVTRGMEDTASTSHDNGTEISNNFTAGTQNELVSQSEFDTHVQEFNEHKANEVSQAEVHGLRATNGKLEYYDGTEWKTVSGGLPVGNVTNFDVQAGNTEVTLMWQDPTDVTLDGATLAEWKGTKILRKTGSYPVDENDGVLVVDSSVRDQYATDGFVDTGLTNDTTYYYSAFPYTTEDVYDKKSDAQATPQPYHIYGVAIDTTNSNPETAVTYTDDATGFTPASGNDGAFSYGSWQDKFPFNQIKPCVFLNGAVNYYLDPNDYSLKEDGTTADITSGADGDVMIEFPKIWWKFERSGDFLYIRYADAQIDSSYLSLAHTRGTTEKDKIYVAAYLGYDDGTSLRSLSGQTPTASETIGSFRNKAQANGTGYEQMPFYPLTMLQILALIMFKNRDLQTALGEGYTDSNNSSSTTTGATDTKGMFYGSTLGTEQVKFCGIEDFYGNLRYWIDGVLYDTNYDMLIGNDGYNDAGDGYTNYGATGWNTDEGGYVDTIQGSTETGFIPASINGSETTYYADYGYIGSDRLPYFGGNWDTGSDAGAFHLYSGAASGSGSSLGARACFV
ncbi:hypothetical protein GCM10008986_16830 [Salinibacillus aidingensis]|uniref:Uncharacterized protein n=1 Tax=Salinibacillus aidingensis TaxID=237684 RepID=A0ABN1B7K5_9BACI